MPKVTTALFALALPMAAADLYTGHVRPLLQNHCLGCHSGSSAQGKLDLSTAEGVKGAVSAGRPGESRLYLAITHQGKAKMPLGKAKLPSEAIAKVAEWITAGAPVNARHWAFEKPERPAVPAGEANPIDAFLAVEHQARGLTATAPADRRTLARRLYLDLTGLPPTPDETRTFLAETYERSVDRLLASPRYGERWGRHWMDVWRYSDWSGYRKANEVRNSQPHIWQWRDWIVESLNEDKPYDRMIVEMLAGDEMAPTDPKVLRATGYLVRNYNRYDRDGWMQNAVDHTAMAFLGLTVKCARCHDHKYDPISQRDYYQFRAFFEPYNVRTDRVPGEPDTAKAGLPRAFDAKPDQPTYLYVNGDVANPDKSAPLAPAIPGVLGRIEAVEPVALPLEARYPDIRDFVHRDLLAAARAEVEKGESPAASQARLKALEARIAADKAKYANAPDAADLAVTARKLERHAHVLKAEADLRRAQEKLSDALKATKPDGEVDEKKIAAAKAEVDKAQTALGRKLESYTPIGEIHPESSTGRRLALARWITSVGNPLTARVAVNHIWMRHFGTPLVPTVFDFGQYGQAPTHPALLDWLATELMARNWSMKAIHRLIVTSKAYQMASSGSETNGKIDPDNRYLWRMNARRMESEAVRDSLLHIAGQLDPATGGPEIEESQEQDSRRRSLYLRHVPDLRPEFLSQFDAADPNECYRRNESVAPQQALSLANSRISLEQSRLLARRLPEQDFIGQAFETVLNRPPAPDERDAAATFLAGQEKLLSTPETLKLFETGIASNVKPAAGAAQRARENLVHVLFNLNEFVTIR
ncbi:MAG: DUF1553 domain-containing protein [Bryobacteraceae bacterium]|nr:DUF1553 domain-containing protein [Bryobacteraceae bacterium]